jgi:ABC-type Co2+ transport system permease subunit
MRVETPFWWRALFGGLHIVFALLLAVVINPWATALYAAVVLTVRLWLRRRRR